MSADRPAERDEFAQICVDPEAFERFYRDHIDRIQNFVARRVHEPHRAADLTADIFLAVIESAATYRSSQGTVTGWLYGVARHVVAADRRRVARNLQVESRISGHRLLEDDDLARIDERIDAHADARHLYAAMSQLSLPERAILELTAVDGLAVTDAARVVGISAVNARVRLHRARDKMRRLLTPAISPPSTTIPEAAR